MPARALYSADHDDPCEAVKEWVSARKTCLFWKQHVTDDDYVWEGSVGELRRGTKSQEPVSPACSPRSSTPAAASPQVLRPCEVSPEHMCPWAPPDFVWRIILCTCFTGPLHIYQAHGGRGWSRKEWPAVLERKRRWLLAVTGILRFHQGQPGLSPVLTQFWMSLNTCPHRRPSLGRVSFCCSPPSLGTDPSTGFNGWMLGILQVQSQVLPPPPRSPP